MAVIPVSDSQGERTDAVVNVSIHSGPIPITPCPPDQDPWPAGPDPCYYAPAQPEVVVLGYMGASNAAEGYEKLGGWRMTTRGLWAPVAVLPNLGLSHMTQDRYVHCGRWYTGFWANYFEPQLGREEAVWLLAPTTDDEWRNGGAPAIRPRLEQVVARIRTYTQVPIYATSPPNMSSYPECKTLKPEQSAATQVAINSVAATGLIELGPFLPDLNASQKLNRCHPNEVGARMWGQVLLDFFG